MFSITLSPCRTTVEIVDIQGDVLCKVLSVDSILSTGLPVVLVSVNLKIVLASVTDSGAIAVDCKVSAT